MLNTFNHHGKTSGITFKILKKVSVFISRSGILKAGFLADPKHSIRKQEKRVDKSTKRLKSFIVLASKSKKKNK